MKNEIRLALLCLAATAAPAFAQTPSPQCGPANFDQTRNAFTVTGRAEGGVNQQCFITVYPTGAMPNEARQYPASYMPEGTYTIELSGGGGGGGAAKSDEHGGGGGASAAPYRIVQYLSPGTYKLTIGAGGEGGSLGGRQATYGGATSLTNATTGQLVAGFPGADSIAPRTRGATDGSGGMAAPGGNSGGSGREHAGGAGGASADASGLGAGGNGGRAGERSADAGNRGGPGFIRLAMAQPAPQAMAPAPMVQAAAPAPVYQSTGAQAVVPEAMPARKSRN